MPKLNITHLPERLKQRIEQLERGDALEARDINALLNEEQQQALKAAWAEQQALRKQHKRPNTDAEKAKLGWKTIREVRLDIYRQALLDVQFGLIKGIEALQQQSEIKAARVFMDAYNKASEEGKNAFSAGNNALVRSGFKRIDILGYMQTDILGYKRDNRRDKEVFEMEEALRKTFEANMTAEEKEQLESSKLHDKAKRK